MDNLLPTITVLMAEASVVLLFLLAILCWRYLRRKRQHEAEIETLIAMAQGREITLPGGAAQESGPEPETAAPLVAREAADESGSESESESESGNDSPAEPAATPPSPRASARTAEPPPAAGAVVASAAAQDPLGEFVKARLAEIRHAQELMDAKLNQIRHDHQKLAANLFRALEKTGKDIADGRHEIDTMHQALSQLRKRIIATSSAVPAPTPRPVAPRQAETPEPAVAPPAEPSAPPTVAAVAADAATAGHEPVALAEGLRADDPDLILDRETLDRLSAPSDARPGNGGIAVEEISLDDLDPQDIREAIGGKSSPFSNPAQVFFQSSTEDMPQGWYFSVHGGPPQGPFTDKLTAELVMEEVASAALPRRETGKA